MYLIKYLQYKCHFRYYNCVIVEECESVTHQHWSEISDIEEDSTVMFARISFY